MILKSILINLKKQIIIQMIQICQNFKQILQKQNIFLKNFSYKNQFFFTNYMQQFVEGFDFDFKNINVEVLEQYKKQVMTETQQAFDNIVKNNTERNFENTARPVIEMAALTQNRFNSFCYAENFYPDEQIRKFASDASAEISKFMIEQQQRKDVYEAFKDYESKNYQNEKSNLTYEENRYIEKTMRDFRREGLHLNDEELVNMKKELSDLTIKFSSNLNEENTTFEFTRKELEGMPESWFTESRIIKKHETDKDQDLFKFTLKYPDYYPCMEYAKSSELRGKLAHAYNSRCSKENVPIVEKVTVLRYKIAKKLGYKNHADFKTEVKIVKTGQNALDFENGLNEKFQGLYEQDMKNLLEFAKNYKENPLGKDNLDPWDIGYYKRAYQEETLDINMEELKSYFPIDVVTKGLFEIYQTLLGLQFQEVETENKWHKDVKFYSVTDKQTKEVIGYFYFDLYPREGKYSHAACFDFQEGCDTTKFQNEKLRAQGRTKNVCCIACNFEPSGCISFSDVETFFHEFGHVMHYICSKTQLQEFGAFHVETDFVEAPSQMLEYWCYEKESLQLMSSHEKTQKPIPEEIVEKLQKKKNTLQGHFNKRQLLFGLYDLKVHTMTFEDGNEKVDSRKIWYDNEYDVMKITNTNQADPAASFGHLMGGYDAGYYGYLRAESYAANMFYKMFKNGNILSPEVGMRYRTKLLEPGSTKDGVQLVEDFLGEKADDQYFLIAKGLTK